MAKPSTTHVIEIESGIGEPAFIPLSMGQELQPISVGKKGMWRLESPRVLDVHAFVYFDGSSLFLQSADENSAAAVDGFRVGKAWTELHAPCTIEVGMARLRYRSLIAEAENQATQALGAPPVQAPPGGPGGPPMSRPGASMPAAGAPPPPMGGQHARLPTGPQPPSSAPASRMPSGQRQAQGGIGHAATELSFPKAERPFKPGEFSSPPDVDESTRFAPLDAAGSGRPGSHPKPALNAPGEEPSTRPEAARVMPGRTGAQPAAGGSGQYNAMNIQGGAPPPSGMMAPMMGSGPPGSMQVYGQPQDPYGQQQQQQQQQGFGPPSYGPSGSGAYGSMGPPGMQQIPGPPGLPQGSMGPSMPPGGFGSMTPQGGMHQPQGPQGPQGPMQDFVAKLKANSIPKIIAGILFIIGGILYLAEDDDPKPVKKKPTATLDGGSLEGGVAAGTGTGVAPPVTAPPVMQPPTIATNAWPPGVPCPPPNWPPNTPLPCTPNNVGTQADNNPPPGKQKDAGAREPREPRDAGPPVVAGSKTLERQAVDAVAAGDNVKASAAYEELVRRDPNNKVYAEAARILRAKLDGGVSGQ